MIFYLPAQTGVTPYICHIQRSGAMDPKYPSFFTKNRASWLKSRPEPSRQWYSPKLASMSKLLQKNLNTRKSNASLILLMEKKSWSSQVPRLSTIIAPGAQEVHQEAHEDTNTAHRLQWESSTGPHGLLWESFAGLQGLRWGSFTGPHGLQWESFASTLRWQESSIGLQQSFTDTHSLQEPLVAHCLWEPFSVQGATPVLTMMHPCLPTKAQTDPCHTLIPPCLVCQCLSPEVPAPPLFESLPEVSALPLFSPEVLALSLFPPKVPVLPLFPPKVSAGIRCP